MEYVAVGARADGEYQLKPEGLGPGFEPLVLGQFMVSLGLGLGLGLGSGLELDFVVHYFLDFQNSSS